MKFKEIRNETINNRHIIEYELYEKDVLKYIVTYDKYEDIDLPPRIIASPRESKYLPEIMSKHNSFAEIRSGNYENKLLIYASGWSELTEKEFNVLLADFQFAKKVAKKLAEKFF